MLCRWGGGVVGRRGSGKEGVVLCRWGGGGSVM